MGHFNHLYEIQPVYTMHQNRVSVREQLNNLWVCGYSPYKLCRKCPLYYGIQAKCSNEMRQKIENPGNRYALYVHLRDVVNKEDIPSLRCQHSYWKNLKPVTEILYQGE